MQQDAIERLNLHQLLLEPEILAAAEPDVNLAAPLVAMKGLIPARTRATARSTPVRCISSCCAGCATRPTPRATSFPTRSSPRSLHDFGR